MDSNPEEQTGRNLFSEVGFSQTVTVQINTLRTENEELRREKIEVELRFNKQISILEANYRQEKELREIFENKFKLLEEIENKEKKEKMELIIHLKKKSETINVLTEKMNEIELQLTQKENERIDAVLNLKYEHEEKQEIVEQGKNDEENYRKEIQEKRLLKQIGEDLKKELEGTDEQKKELIENQENDCELLSRTFVEQEDDVGTIQVIKSGIIENLLFIISNRNINLITRKYSKTFIDLTNNSSDEAMLIIYNLKPYPGLIRLLEHQDDYVASDSISTIYNILDAFAKTTSDTEPHPHYESIQQFDGVNKIFALFHKNGSKYSRDNSAICIGYIFRAREITDPNIKHEIINYIKCLLSDSDDDDNDWVQKRAQTALRYLAQNDSNRSGILNVIDLKNINQDLKQQIEGTKQQQKSILQQQESDLLLLSTLLQKKYDNELHQRIISSEIVENLLFIFSNRDLKSITRTHSQTFFNITKKSTDEVKLLIYNSKPYPGLFRLLEHQDYLVASDAIISIFNILISGSKMTQYTEPHPHYESIQQCDGVNKIISLFQKNLSKYSRDRCAICIGFIFRAREITNLFMKQEIFTYLKILLSDSDDWIKERAKDSLEYLAQNDKNRSEILNENELKKIGYDLRQSIDGTEEEKKEIIKKQEFNCILLYSVLYRREDYQLRRDVIDAGIVDALIHIYTSRDLNNISKPYIEVFFVLTHPYCFPVSQLLIEKKSFPSLLRLLDHQDDIVVGSAIVSINNILCAGAIETELVSNHPYQKELASAGGIEKIFSLFKQTTNQFTQKISSISLGIIFRAQEIKDSSMRMEIIPYLKTLIDCVQEDVRKLAKYALQCLEQNQVNKAVIESNSLVITE
ncbi:MAG: hypothetical protein EZS28_013663 [Streblomastix strix]|uniref:Uncharacterized protein n=1 Tax=Streblomastix strix TaxID=222440 RepID=A0A5J4W8Z4_9EUKA|nr:MAG: hypothetical protein EZS28_013663 [Streblomastix strix]